MPCSGKNLPTCAVSICQFCPWGHWSPSRAGLALMGPVGQDLAGEGGHQAALMALHPSYFPTQELTEGG